MISKTNPGRFFEDFKLEETLVHATPRTITAGDQAVYTALYPTRYAFYSSDLFAQQSGFARAPLEDIAAFHVAFGKTVPDVSLNAIANLGYAEGRFLQPVYTGDTIATTSEVIGLKENSNGKTGVVYVRSTGRNQHQEAVIEYVRWVMVRKKSADSPAPETVIPNLSKAVDAEALILPKGLHFQNYDCALAGSPYLWEDYEIGEKIDHVDGVTTEESDHMLATRLWQNTAKVHFNQHSEAEGRFGKRLIYGGHVISTARALSFNGLANAQMIAAINGGTHVAPLFSGDTVYAWSEVLDKAPTAEASVGALRLRMVAVKNQTAASFPLRNDEGRYVENVILDFDYWAFMPRRN